MFSTARVLFAGDDPCIQTIHRLLELGGHSVSRSADVAEAARRIGAGEADVVVMAGGAVGSLEQLVEAQGDGAPPSFVAVAAALSHVQLRATLGGSVCDVVDPSWDERTILVAIERAARDGRLRREMAMLRARVGDAAQHALVGRSAAIARVRELIGRAAASRAPVLISGEAGTGKDVVARLVHDLSERAARPLITVRCAGTDTDALERELFGRAAGERGRARAGVLEEAHGGTLVLDDALALPADLRARLARASGSRTAPRVGATESIPVDARLVLIARTRALASSAQSTEDLLDRFNAMIIDVPPLRERRSDIPQLVQHFRQRLAVEQGRALPPLAADELLPLLGREWTGNVRELEQWVDRRALVAKADAPRENAEAPDIDPQATPVTLAELERRYILRVLALESGHQSRTAARLGIDRRTLYRKLKQYRSE